MTRVAGFIFFLLVSAAVAQKQPARGKVSAVAANKLTALKVTGTARYTDKEILAASGLQIGQNAADGDFREAAQRLGDSGLFSDVVYSYSSSGAGVRLEMQLADAEPGQAGSRALRKLRLVHRRRTPHCARKAAFRCSSSCCRLQAIFPTGFPRRCKPSSPRSNFQGG